MPATQQLKCEITPKINSKSIQAKPQSLGKRHCKLAKHNGNQDKDHFPANKFP